MSEATAPHHEEEAPFRCQRDSDSRSGWSVVGPNDFVLHVHDEVLGLAIGKLLSGKTTEAAEAAQRFAIDLRP